MKIYVDIDETICFYNGERNYPDAIPDFKNQVGTANLTMGFKTYPSETGTTISRDVTNTTKFFDLRGRGRQTNVKITSNTLGSDWRYGTLRLDIKPDGGR